MLDLRLYQCARDVCRRIAFVCRECDHGQIYCSRPRVGGARECPPSGIDTSSGTTAPAAFYRYFESKDALLLALETRTALRYYARFFAAFAVARKALPKLRPRARARAEILVAASTRSSRLPSRSCFSSSRCS